MRLLLEPYDLQLREVLRISRGGRDRAANVLATLEAGGQTGLGEAAPSPYFGETQASTLEALRLFADDLGDDPFLYDAILERIDGRIPGSYAAKAALDLALHDLVGKLLGMPLYRLLGLDPSGTAHLAYTIGIDTVDRMVQAARTAAQHYRVLKVKLGTTYDEEIVRAVCAAVDAVIRVDVNGGWQAPFAVSFAERVLAPLGVQLLEQPVAADDYEGLKLVHDHSPVPLIADESVTDLSSVPRLAGRCSGIDIKLQKCGGIRAARAMIATARAHGLKVMLGCNVESTLAVTAAAHLTPLADYADLDLHLLLTNDPFVGVTIEEGRFVLPDGPGLGVRRVVVGAPSDGGVDVAPATAGGVSTMEKGN